jgi:hypothetical protein
MCIQSALESGWVKNSSLYTDPKQESGPKQQGQRVATLTPTSLTLASVQPEGDSNEQGISFTFTCIIIFVY